MSIRQAVKLVQQATALLVTLEHDDQDQLTTIAETLAAAASQGGLSDSIRERLDAVAVLLSSVSEHPDEERDTLIEQAGKDVEQMGEELERALNALGEPPPIQPVTSETRGTCSNIHEAKRSLDSSLPEAVMDDELLGDYVAESLDYLDSAEAALLTLESDPSDSDHLNAVFRCFHTIKGTSSFLGLTHIKELAHLAEGLLDDARRERLTLAGPNADLALSACDALRVMVASVGRHEDEAEVALAQEPVFAKLRERDAKRGTRDPASEDGKGRQGTRPEGIIGQSRRESAASSVRVNTGRLDAVLNLIGELVIAHSLISNDERLLHRGLEKMSQNVGRAGSIVHQLQDLAMQLRMVPLRPTFQKITRVVRDLSRTSGKPVELVTEGEDTEIDRNMVEQLSGPLLHLARNALDHGIEIPEERRAAKKSTTGRLLLRAFHSAGRIVIELSDDGRGIDRRAVLTQATKRGLIDPGQVLADSEVLALIFHPGFSTRQDVNEISGRGVGMDVVKKQVEALRGRVEIRSREGAGTTFVLRLPLTTAIMDAMLVRVGSQRLLLPTISIIQSFQPPRGSITAMAGEGETALLRDELLRMVRLHEVLGVGDAKTDPYEAILVVIEAEGRRCALLADNLLGQQQVVIKSIGEDFGELPGISGAAILGNGEVGLILDAYGLIELAASHATEARRRVRGGRTKQAHE